MQRLLTLLFFLSISAVMAQTAVLKGKVVDKTTMEPIAWAVIYTTDSLITAESGLEGHYRMSRLVKDKIDIRVRAFPDYKDTLIDGIDLKRFKKKSFIIRLTPEDIKTVFSSKSDKCPVCLSAQNAVPIIYGEQTFEMIAQQQKQQLIFAGCCHYPSYPLWYCKKCRVKY